MSVSRPLAVAVVGSGPSAVFAVEALLASGRTSTIDVIERLPAPFGLLRYGVAPDHPRIKQIVASFSSVLEGAGVRFFGNVEVGRDVSIPDLADLYDAIVVATGAGRDAPLAIPGADLERSRGAAELVAWYDGHPDAPSTWPLDVESVAVVGVGNVALDVARVLAKDPDELASTDVPGGVLETLRASRVTDVHIFGRRGPRQVKFTPLELREIGRLSGVDVVLDPEDFSADQSGPGADGGRRAEHVAREFAEWLERVPTGARRRIHVHLFHRPVEILDDGNGGVGGVRFERMRWEGEILVGTGETREYPAGAVFHAIGYRGTAIEGVPFDEATGTIPNEAGRVVADGAPVPGLYATGWIRRGPSGLIGSSKSDAQEAVESLLADADAGAERPEPEGDLALLLAERGVEAVDWQGWLAIDAEERRLGAARGCERVKIATRDGMLSAARRTR